MFSNSKEEEESISEQIETLTEKKDYFDFIKSINILKKIFKYLHKRRKLKFLKCNKMMQKKLDIGINDFKEYSEKFSTIEIEIIPAKNKYGKFINYKNYHSRYFNIFFNNGQKRINRNFINENDKVKKINILISYHINSFYELFFCCDCIESINFKSFLRTNIENMNWMFYGCSSLKHLNLSSFSSINVISMKAMFNGCSSLEELDLSNFNTNNVTNMCEMFFGCSSLRKLDLSNFNTNKVTNMSQMFYGCSSLEELNISNFNTNNVNDFYKMFDKCSKELITKIESQNKNINIQAFK